MKRLLLLFALCGVRLCAQPSPLPQIYYVTSAPIGACTVAQPLGLQIVISTGDTYFCEGTTVGGAGTWTKLTSGGGGGSPTGPAGGVLSGSYPNPGFNTSQALPGTYTTTTQPATDKSTALATDSFVQGLFGSLNQAVSVEAATVTVLPANTYNNGAAGVGATLTGNSNGALAAIDGYTAAVGNRLLINNEANAAHNGVYTLTTLGNGGAPYVLTRATDFNTVTQINTSGAIPVLNGTVNNNTLWVLGVPITAIGTGAPTAAINYVLGAATAYPTLTLTNASSTGTTLNKLVKLTGAPSTGVINTTTDTTGAIGICLANCGTSGAASIGATPGFIYPCIFDAATTAGDWVQISPNTNGDCHDTGVASTSVLTTPGEVVGVVQTTHAAGGTFTVLWGDVNTIQSSNGTKTIAAGTAALATGAITSGTCASVVTVGATGVATTDNIMGDFNADPTSTTGYSPSVNGMLAIIKYPTSNNVNFKVCNNTSASITPGAVTLNWRVVR